jgi:hypothetical protein
VLRDGLRQGDMVRSLKLMLRLRLLDDVVQGTLEHPSRRFNEHAHHWGLLARALTYMITMVDLTNISRHDPTVRPNTSIVLPARGC